MKRETINPYWLGVPLYPLTGLADDDEAVMKYRSLDPEDENVVRCIIREQIVPYYGRVDPQSQWSIKRAYQFYLSREDTRWDRVYNSALLPFDHPRNCRHFFVWIWEECFPGEDWRVDDFSQFEVRPDINELQRMRLVGP